MIKGGGVSIVMCVCVRACVRVCVCVWTRRLALFCLHATT